jgi:hypothetical protein
VACGPPVPTATQPCDVQPSTIGAADHTLLSTVATNRTHDCLNSCHGQPDSYVQTYVQTMQQCIARLSEHQRTHSVCRAPEPTADVIATKDMCRCPSGLPPTWHALCMRRPRSVAGVSHLDGLRILLSARGGIRSCSSSSSSSSSSGALCRLGLPCWSTCNAMNAVTC